MIVTVVGAEGFVGSAFVRHLRKDKGVTDLREVIRSTIGKWRSDIVIDCTGNARKYIAERDPVSDFDMSVAERMETLHDYPADTHLFVSSIDHKDGSNYDVHKRIAETLVAHYANDYLIVRFSGMVGMGLKKNAVYDIMHGLPIHVHPESRYQYMLTDDAARMAWTLLKDGRLLDVKIINVVGDGLISLPEVAELAGRDLDLSLVQPDWVPWTQETDITLLKAIMPVPRTADTIKAYVRA